MKTIKTRVIREVVACRGCGDMIAKIPEFKYEDAGEDDEYLCKFCRQDEEDMFERFGDYA